MAAAASGEPIGSFFSVAGEFKDPSTESSFRREMLSESVRQAQVLFFMCAAASALFLIANYLLSADATPIGTLARFSSIAASLVAAALVGRVPSALVEPCIVVWQVIISVGFAMAAANNQAMAVAAMFLLPALFYLAVPTSFVTTIAAGAGCSLLMLLSYNAGGWEGGDHRLLGTALVSLNLVLMMLKSRSSRQLRREWAFARQYRTALKELSESRSLLERTFASVPTPLVVTAIATGEVVRTNLAAERFLGLEGKLIGRKAAEFYRQPAERTRLTQNLARDGAVHHFRTQMIASGGISRSVLIDASVVGETNGDGHMVASVLDVTDAEEQERKLLHAEAEYRAHFENSVVGIYRSTPEGKMLRANPALVKLNGYRTEQELISSVNDIASEWYVEPARREEWMRILRERGLVTDFVSEVYRHKTRERIWVSESGWLVRNDEGQPLHFEGTLIEVTARKLAEAETERLARHDALTDLPNRRLFDERLDQAISATTLQGVGCALICLDLDRFKAVNDAFGHTAGDLLLQEAARRLTQACRTEDFVARMGGDEFTVLLPLVDSEKAATDVAKRLLAAFQQPFDLGGPRALIGASIGIAIAPAHATDRSDLIRKADDALYRAKRSGRNKVVVHEPDNGCQVPNPLGVRSGRSLRELTKFHSEPNTSA